MFFLFSSSIFFLSFSTLFFIFSTIIIPYVQFHLSSLNCFISSAQFPYTLDNNENCITSKIFYNLAFSLFSLMFHLLCQFLNLIDNAKKYYLIFTLYCKVSMRLKDIFIYCCSRSVSQHLSRLLFQVFWHFLSFYFNYRSSWFERTFYEHLLCIFIAKNKWEIKVKFIQM